MTSTRSTVRATLVLFALLSALVGVAYPLLVAGVAAAAWPGAAEGSLLRQGARVLGSSLVGQSFSDPGHFWGRPSATTPQPYNGLASGGSNLGPLNPALADAVKLRLQALHAADPLQAAPVPVDLVTASASGLDPHISPAAAHWQAARVARVRGLPVDKVQALVDAATETPVPAFLGPPVVNVLRLNLALDRLQP